MPTPNTTSIDPLADLSHHTVGRHSWPNYTPYTTPTTHDPCRVCGQPIQRDDRPLAYAGQLGAGKWVASWFFREIASCERTRPHPRNTASSSSIAVTTFPPSPPRLASARRPQKPHDVCATATGIAPTPSVQSARPPHFTNS